MKKLIACFLALVICLSFVACGDNGEDAALQALADAYNTVAPIYNEAYTTAEENGWLNDELTYAELSGVGATLGPIGEALSSDPGSLDPAKYEALAEMLLQLEAPLYDLLDRVSVPYEG